MHSASTSQHFNQPNMHLKTDAHRRKCCAQNCGLCSQSHVSAVGALLEELQGLDSEPLSTAIDETCHPQQGKPLNRCAACDVQSGLYCLHFIFWSCFHRGAFRGKPCPCPSAQSLCEPLMQRSCLKLATQRKVIIVA